MDQLGQSSFMDTTSVVRQEINTARCRCEQSIESHKASLLIETSQQTILFGSRPCEQCSHLGLMGKGAGEQRSAEAISDPHEASR
jgi:hypothetical protein